MSVCLVPSVIYIYIYIYIYILLVHERLLQCGLLFRLPALCPATSKCVLNEVHSRQSVNFRRRMYLVFLGGVSLTAWSPPSTRPELSNCLEQSCCFVTSGNCMNYITQHWLHQYNSTSSGYYWNRCFYRRVSCVLCQALRLLLGGGLICTVTSFFLTSFAGLPKDTVSFLHICLCLSVRPSTWNNSAPTGRIFMKFDIWLFFRKSVDKIQVSLKSGKNNRYFTWRPIYIFNNISLNSS